MGCRSRERELLSDSDSDSLLLATMCIVGLPVHVHLTDASVYSGIFHTASLHNHCGGQFLFHLLLPNSVLLPRSTTFDELDIMI